MPVKPSGNSIYIISFFCVAIKNINILSVTLLNNFSELKGEEHLRNSYLDVAMTLLKASG